MSHRVTLVGLLIATLIPAVRVSAGDDDAEISQPATFTRDVLPILQEHCQECHRTGGANLGGMVAPMAFTTYEESRPWAKSMARAVKTGRMPPWHASAAHSGVFLSERRLSDGEIDTVVRWAGSGAKRGDAVDAPEPKAFPTTFEGWTIGEPDLIVRMPEPYFVDDDVSDLTVNFATRLSEEQLPEDRWIKAVEFRPGSRVVHHIVATPLGGIAPGNGPTVYREGYSALLRKSSTIIFNMHYHKEAGPGTGEWDQSEVAVRFYPEGYVPEHVIVTEPLGAYDFEIPPGAESYTAEAEYRFSEEALILHLFPHMHLRGKAAKYTLFFPDGGEEVLLDIPRYDYNWQTTYRFREPRRVPAGTRIHLQGWWDNSAGNEDNPDPTARIVWGEASDEEMLFGWMGFTPVNAGPDGPSGYNTSPNSTGRRLMEVITKARARRESGGD